MPYGEDFIYALDDIFGAGRHKDNRAALYALEQCRLCYKRTKSKVQSFGFGTVCDACAKAGLVTYDGNIFEGVQGVHDAAGYLDPANEMYKREVYGD
tara:strand:+ start:69 stop:359 length:291 start_codon:yes stop_codon:yes gene_type:complete